MCAARAGTLAAMRRFALLSLGLLLAGCGGERAASSDTGGTDSGLSGRIQIDGSSTLAPYATAAAEGFRRDNPGVQVTVGVSGTGGGFERFCRGETDISDASRTIEDDEEAACEEKGIDDVEIQVANDALTVVVNPENDWADCLTVAQLKTIWDTGSKAKSWKDVDPSFPDVELKLYGPGTDSGTFDYFTKEINGEEGQSRSDYAASEDDNVIVQGVSGDEGALGYFGLSYYDQNKDKLTAIGIDGGNGCVEPSVDTAQSGTYVPLSRPLFMYANAEALTRPEVEAFLRYVLGNEREIAHQAQFVPLTDEQLQQAKDALGS
jgi:phosphate transport system substrate-binding protein